MKNLENTLTNYGNQPKTMKDHESTLKNQGGRAGISKNVTYAGSQLTGEGGQGRNKQKRHTRGVTNDLGGGAGQE